MKKIEYTEITIEVSQDLIEILNEMGQQGWEAISINEYAHVGDRWTVIVFKREVENKLLNELSAKVWNEYIAKTANKGINFSFNSMKKDFYETLNQTNKCADCGKKLTIVRPGKYQCDNVKCLQTPGA